MRPIIVRLLMPMLAVVGIVALTAGSSAAQDELAITASITSATFDRAGTATLKGTVACSQPVQLEGYGTLTQPVGRLNAISGYFNPPYFLCPGPQGTQFTLIVTPNSGKFRGGKAVVQGYLDGCVYDDLCGATGLDTTVKLSRA